MLPVRVRLVRSTWVCGGVGVGVCVLSVLYTGMSACVLTTRVRARQYFLLCVFISVLFYFYFFVFLRFVSPCVLTVCACCICTYVCVCVCVCVVCVHL